MLGVDSKEIPTQAVASEQMFGIMFLGLLSQLKPVNRLKYLHSSAW